MVEAADQSLLLSRLKSHSVDAAECSSLLSWLMISLLESHSVDAFESAIHRNESPSLTFVLVPTVLVDV
jgi:hypothetical protein